MKRQQIESNQTRFGLPRCAVVRPQVKTKLLYALSAMLMLTTLFVTSCKKDTPDVPETIQVEKITFESSSSADFVLSMDGSKQLTITVSPSNASDKSITWTTSDPKVATVVNGLVKAIGEGTAIITAKTKNGKTATVRVTVAPLTVAVTGVTLNKTTLSLVEGANETLIATVNPEGATNKDLVWSSNDALIATVDQEGNVTAVAAGAATITVTTDDGAKTATCEVTVTAKPVDAIVVTGVTLDKSTLSLTEGASESLIATINPEDATNKAISWTSDNLEVATVDVSGMVTAIAEGTATITVTTDDGAKTATCVVTVTKASVSVLGVTLDNTVLSFVEGSTTPQTLVATVNPEGASNKDVTWESSNHLVATVSGGVVTLASTAKAGQTATITVTTVDGAKTATCEVTVASKPIPKPVVSVSLNKSSLSLIEGNSETLVATINPSDADNTAVTWSSSNSLIASVDPTTGAVSAISQGTATITVKTQDGSKIATCFVTVSKKIVVPKPVISVSINKPTLSLIAGSSETLTATINPSDADNTTVTWNSTNPSVASVNPTTGAVSANSPGNATIIVTTQSGSKTASCAVTVTKKVPTSLSFHLKGSSSALSSPVDLAIGQSKEFDVKFSPADATIDGKFDFIVETPAYLDYSYNSTTKVLTVTAKAGAAMGISQIELNYYTNADGSGTQIDAMLNINITAATLIDPNGNKPPVIGGGGAIK